MDGGGGVSLLQRSLLTALSPLQRGVDALIGGVAEAWRGYGFHRETYTREPPPARRGCASSRRSCRRAPHRAQEADRLRELLELRQALPLETIAAQVVGRDGRCPGSAR